MCEYEDVSVSVYCGMNWPFGGEVIAWDTFCHGANFHGLIIFFLAYTHDSNAPKDAV